MNFFDATCQEPAINQSEFGLCDDQDGTKAYTDITDATKWVATVKNPKQKNLVFTAIDACVIKSNEEVGRGRCDGMLTSDEHLFFVELKEQRSNWISGAIDQLESTIQFFIQNHDISIYRHKKAFACNKKHSGFQEIDNALNKRFFTDYKVRIDVQAEIIIV
jgi:hypothetical protein